MKKPEEIALAPGSPFKAPQQEATAPGTQPVPSVGEAISNINQEGIRRGENLRDYFMRRFADVAQHHGGELHHSEPIMVPFLNNCVAVLHTHLHTLDRFQIRHIDLRFDKLDEANLAAVTLLQEHDVVSGGNHRREALKKVTLKDERFVIKLTELDLEKSRRMGVCIVGPDHAR